MPATPWSTWPGSPTCPKASNARPSTPGCGPCSWSRRTVPLEAYVAKFERDGGIVEERIVGEELLSPSVQLRARPDGSVELLSTHDQLLGGASGQSYLGCLFPADPAYSRLISEPAQRIGDRLAAAGALGRFAIDFVVVKDETGSLVGVRDRAQPPQGRDHPPVPDPAVPHRRQLRRREWTVPDLARAARSISSPPTTWSPTIFARCRWTTCSTRSPGTDCTSTSRARPGWSST